MTRVTERGRFVATDVADRFWSQVDRTGGPDACWLWLGACDQQGRPVFRVKDAVRGWLTAKAYRWAYEAEHGPLAPDVTLDHECHTDDPVCPGGVTCLHRRCVNQAHLAPVTRGENTRRAAARRARLRG